MLKQSIKKLKQNSEMEMMVLQRHLILKIAKQVRLDKPHLKGAGIGARDNSFPLLSPHLYAVLVSI